MEASRLDWDERVREPHAGILAWYHDLVALRRRNPALRDADRSAATVRHDPDAGWLLLDRGPVSVAVNLGAEAVEVEVEGEVRLAWPADLDARDGRTLLPPDGVLVVERPA